MKHLSQIEGTKAKRQDQHKYLTNSPPKPEVYTKPLYSVRAKNKSTAQKLYEWRQLLSGLVSSKSNSDFGSSTHAKIVRQMQGKTYKAKYI